MRSPRYPSLLWALTAGLLAFGCAQGTELDTLTASDGAPGDLLGESVAMSGDYAIVGAPACPEAGGFAKGSAYVYERGPGGWVEVDELTPDNKGFLPCFGTAVAIEGTTALVGSPRDGTSGEGSVYVFERMPTGWKEVDELFAPDGVGGDRFGHAVTLSGDHAVVGAPEDTLAAGIVGAGAAYVFQRDDDEWAFAFKLIAQDAGIEDEFGSSVSLFADRAVVGAPGDDGTAVDEGSAYVFDRHPITEVWQETAKLAASNASANARFGHAVSASAEKVLVGAPRPTPDLGATGTHGQAYVYDVTGAGAQEIAVLQSLGAVPRDRFGTSVHLSGGNAIVGAPGFSNPPDGHPHKGAVYAFEDAITEWKQRARFVSSQAAEGDRIGQSVASAGTLILAGAPSVDFGADADVGAAYTFSICDAVATFIEAAELDDHVALLFGQPSTVSLSKGGVHTLDIEVCPPTGNHAYFVLGSISGTTPPLDVNGALLPLNTTDPYFNYTFFNPNTAFLSDSLGILSMDGKAQSTMNIAPGVDPSIAGTLIHHAYLVFSNDGPIASGPVPVELVP